MQQSEPIRGNRIGDATSILSAFESLERVEELLARYDTAAPRYTSYPTAPAWTDRFGPAEFERALGALEDRRGGLALYVHVPFCASLCHFCACNRVITRKPELPERYLDAIRAEIAQVRDKTGSTSPVTQVHWGGGTPTHLAAEQIRALFSFLTDAFPLADAAEVSIEVDPRVTTREHVETLRELGFNRISLGVQDFDARVQAAVHRVQPVEQTARLVEWCRELGFRSVNFDLIYGLPFQSEASFDRTLELLFDLEPDRIALYAYAHVTWVAKQQRGFERHDLPDARTRLRIMALAVRRFLTEGYAAVGMDHFARPDDELVRARDAGTLRRNFMGYTTQAGVDLIGFGPSAISELHEAYAQSHRDLFDWHTAVGSGRLATLRGHVLSEHDREQRFIIHQIMCQGEVRADDYAHRFGGSLRERYAGALEALEPARADGLVEIGPDGSLRATPLGMLLVRNLAMAFDHYLPAQRRAGRPLFSRTI